MWSAKRTYFCRLAKTPISRRGWTGDFWEISGSAYPAEPAHLQNPDGSRTRYAFVLDIRRVQRNALSEVHGQCERIGCRALRGEVLRPQGVPCPVAAVLQANG